LNSHDESFLNVALGWRKVGNTWELEVIPENDKQTISTNNLVAMLSDIERFESAGENGLTETYYSLNGTDSPTQDEQSAQSHPAPTRRQTAHLATEDELIRSFKCKSDIFKSGHKFEWFRNARIVRGKGGNSPIKPQFDPYLFGMGLIGTTYGKNITESEVWNILERDFSDRYLEVDAYRS
jgi:hypothetical protein